MTVQTFIGVTNDSGCHRFNAIKMDIFTEAMTIALHPSRKYHLGVLCNDILASWV